MSERIKKYINCSVVYSILALAGGVFYREFTKHNGFTSDTSLSVVHTHYFVFGMMFFLLLALLEKSFNFSDKSSDKMILGYHIGLNLTVILLIVRGVLQVLSSSISYSADKAISGIAGTGHIILSLSLVLLLLKVKKSIK